MNNFWREKGIWTRLECYTTRFLSVFREKPGPGVSRFWALKHISDLMTSLALRPGQDNCSKIKLHRKIMTNSGNQPWHFWRSPNGILCLISLSGIAVNFMIFNFSFSCLISLNSAVCFALIRAAHSN